MINEINSPKLKDPVFIAAWPGMGEVAYRAVLFLKEVLDFKLFAKLEAKTFFKPAAVIVQEGVVNFPAVPTGFFYYLKKKNCPDMILFLGEAQPPLEYAEVMSRAIINFVKKHKAKFMLTFAAKPESIDHRIDPSVWVVGTQSEIIKKMEKFNAKVLKEGQISGLNGIILGMGKKRGLQGACLLGEIPFYTVQVENPKATTNILKIVNDYLGLNLNLNPLIERSKYIEEEIDKLITYLKGEPGEKTDASDVPLPLSEDDLEKIKKDLAAFTKLPQSAREKIDILFKQAQTDIGKANSLKKELDRWNVYKEYEDKFLDLFKRNEKRNKREKPH